MTIDELKATLSRFHIKPDKRLGQNFLLSDEVLDKIVAAGELVQSDTVLEIGPGLGFLTARLADAAGQVVAVEKDRKLAFALRKIFKNKKTVKIINDDALFIDPQSVIARTPSGVEGDEAIPETRLPDGQVAARLAERERGRAPATQVGARNDDQVKFKLIANIPYYLTGKLLKNFLSPLPSPPPPDFAKATTGTRGEGNTNEFLPLDSRRYVGVEGGGEVGVKPSLMVLLLQKEVAQRIVAKPGDMSLLSVSVQFYADPEIISYVPKENFYPIPEVDSAIVRLRVLPKPRLDVDVNKFFQLVKIGFSNKRKQLQNNLANNFTLPQPLPSREGNSSPLTRDVTSELRGEDKGGGDYKKLLQSLGLNPLVRAQDLSLEDWNKLYNCLFDG